MAITAAVVNELRQATGCGLMDCKKALIECEGDMEKAVMYLREKGLASQAKKASRVAAEGMAYATVTGYRCRGSPRSPGWPGNRGR